MLNTDLKEQLHRISSSTKKHDPSLTIGVSMRASHLLLSTNQRNIILKPNFLFIELVTYVIFVQRRLGLPHTAAGKVVNESNQFNFAPLGLVSSPHLGAN